MRSKITSLVVLAVALSGGSANAGSPTKTRTVTASYTAPGGLQDQLAGQYFVNDKLLLGGFSLSPTRKEKTVAITLADTTGRPVPAALLEDLNDDGVGDVDLASFCTKTPGPVRIKHPAAHLLVYVFAGTCAGLPTTPTAGTATAIFSP